MIILLTQGRSCSAFSPLSGLGWFYFFPRWNRTKAGMPIHFTDNIGVCFPFSDKKHLLLAAQGWFLRNQLQRKTDRQHSSSITEQHHCWEVANFTLSLSTSLEGFTGQGGLVQFSKMQSRNKDSESTLDQFIVRLHLQWGDSTKEKAKPHLTVGRAMAWPTAERDNNVSRVSFQIREWFYSVSINWGKKFCMTLL